MSRLTVIMCMLSPLQYQEYIIKEKRVSNFTIANVECMRKVT